MKGFEQIETTHSFQNKKSSGGTIEHCIHCSGFGCHSCGKTGYKVMPSKEGPPRTWVDAAIDVAWNALEKRGQVCIACLLQETHSTGWWCSPRVHPTIVVEGHQEADFLHYYDGYCISGGPYSKEGFKEVVGRWLRRKQ